MGSAKHWSSPRPLHFRPASVWCWEVPSAASGPIWPSGGGVQAPLVLGSRSSETRLRAGDVLPAQAAMVPVRHPDGLIPQIAFGEPIRIVDGPDTVPGIDLRSWRDMEFRVGLQS